MSKAVKANRKKVSEDQFNRMVNNAARAKLKRKSAAISACEKSKREAMALEHFDPEVRRAAIDAQIAAFESRGGRIQVDPGYIQRESRKVGWA